MPLVTLQSPVSYLLTFAAADVAHSLGTRSANSLRWSSRFCTGPGHGCTLDESGVIEIVRSVDNHHHRYHAARSSGVFRSIQRSLEGMFRSFYDAIERCVDIHETDCRCSWDRRLGDAERLWQFLIVAVQAGWSAGGDRARMTNDLETLACRVTDVCEMLSARVGKAGRFDADDMSAEARADRLAMYMFDAANDVACDNFAVEDCMSRVPNPNLAIGMLDE